MFHFKLTVSSREAGGEEGYCAWRCRARHNIFSSFIQGNQTILLLTLSKAKVKHALTVVKGENVKTVCTHCNCNSTSKC